MSKAHERVKTHAAKVESSGLVRCLAWIPNDPVSRKKLAASAKRLRKASNMPLPRD